MEEPLSFWTRMSLRFHLMMCVLCRRYAKHIRTVEHLARGLSERTEQGDAALPEGLSPDAKKRLKSALDAES
jgi:hypothetical protein